MRLRSVAVLLCVGLGCSNPETSVFPEPTGADPPLRGPLLPDGHDFPPPTMIKVDRELLVTDAALLTGPLARNDRDEAPWSFRWLVEQLAPPGRASEMVLAWLETWNATSRAVDGQVMPLRKRDAVASSLVCPWLKLTPSNACDATCSRCDARVLDLAKAPFKLLAIVNRLDLAEQATGCDPSAAEARFVFVATAPGTSTPLSFNAIFEYKVAGTVADDPQTWHALGALKDDAYAEGLATLTRSFSNRAATLGQIRTSENLAGEAAGSPWELRQFSLRNGALVPALVANTPSDDLDGTPQLGAHVVAKLDRIQAGDNAIDPTEATAFATMKRADFKWSAPDAPELALRLFGLSTCNGCHAGERGDTSVLPFAHIGVDARGATIVSRFLRDPDRPGSDELSFRSQSLERQMRGECGGPQTSYGARRGFGLEVPPRVPAGRVH